MKDRELRALEERLEAVDRRLISVEQGHAKSGQGAGELASSLAELSQLVRRQVRLLSLNSFAAYLIFTVLLCAVFYFLYTARAGEAEAERDRALAARDAAMARAEGTARHLAARDAADRAAVGVLELLRQRKYREAIAAHRELGGVELGAAQRQFLADAVAVARAELVADAALRSRQAFDGRDHQRGHDLATAGLALAAAGGRAAEGPATAELRYVAAASLEKLGRADEARAAYAAFLAAAPDHEMARRARQRLTRLERAAGAPAAEPAAPPPAPPSAPPAASAPARSAPVRSAPPPARSAPGRPARPSPARPAPARPAPARPAPR